MVKNKNATFAANGLLLLFTATIAGLIWSRALLSIAQVAWLVVTVFLLIKSKIDIRRNPVIVWSILPLLLFLLGLYQQPLAKDNYDYLLTLSMYPVAALGSSILFRYVAKDTCLKVWIAIAVVSLLLPLISYISNIPGTYQLYAQAKTLRVWMSADHVRYGLFISASFLFLLSYKLISSKVRYALLSFIFIMIVLISVRTAWVAAGIIVLVSGWRQISNTKYRNLKWLIPVIFIIFSLASYKFINSVKGKVDYTIYDWQSFDQHKYSADFSDGARRQINYIAWKSITTGEGENVGWSAISNKLKTDFAKHFPDQKADYGWPFNQWLFWWMGAGWWTTVFYSLWLLFPLMWGIKNKNHSLCSWTLVIIASCIVECTLSLQFGVFLHAWVTALLWLPLAKEEYGNSENQKALFR